MRRRVIIPGAVLVGFAELFDKAFGDPKSPTPYPMITPSRLNATLLPFACPRCGCPVDPKRADRYTDPTRGFQWCPSCGLRYKLDRAGAPLSDPLPADAETAPALVAGRVYKRADDALSCLGAS